jgi:hypothetical protein
MAPPRKPPSRVTGVDYVEAEKKWRVRYYENGKRKACKRTTEAEAHLCADDLRRRFGQAPEHAAAKNPEPPPTVRLGNGDSASDVRRLMWWLMIRVARGEVAAQRQLAVIAQAARSYFPLLDRADIEARIEALEEQEREVSRMRKHGARAARQARPTRQAPQPGTPIQ